MHRRHSVENLEGAEMTVREDDLCFPRGDKLCTRFPRLPSCGLLQYLSSDTATAAFVLCCPGFFAFLLQRQFFLPGEHELSPPSGRLRP